MMKFSSMMAIVFSFLTVGAVHSTYMYSRNETTGDIDLSIAGIGVASIIFFAVMAFVFWQRSVKQKNKEKGSDN